MHTSLALKKKKRKTEIGKHLNDFCEWKYLSVQITWPLPPPLTTESFIYRVFVSLCDECSAVTSQDTVEVGAGVCRSSLCKVCYWLSRVGRVFVKYVTRLYCTLHVTNTWYCTLCHGLIIATHRQSRLTANRRLAMTRSECVHPSRQLYSGNVVRYKNKKAKQVQLQNNDEDNDKFVHRTKNFLKNTHAILHRTLYKIIIFLIYFCWFVEVFFPLAELTRSLYNNVSFPTYITMWMKRDKKKK